MFDETFWVGISLLMFLGFLVYMKVPGMVVSALDARAKKIQEELDNARKLREDAQALLAQYQRRQRAAEQEAEEIVALARADAQRMAEEARVTLATQMERRIKLAEDKITQAEAQALDEVRRTAAEVAVAAARKLIAERLSAEEGARLIDAGIEEMGAKLH